MSIVQHTLTPAPAPPEFRWNPRVYPGDLARIAGVRADVRADLAALPELPDDLVETVVLCVSEAFANAVEHTRSGEPDGQVIRTLTVPAPGVLRLSIIDDGVTDTRPRIPRERTAAEWDAAERGRGLLLIATLATAWGTRPVVAFPFCAELGTVIWMDFTFSATEAAR